MATDTLEIFGDEFTGVTGIKATDDNNNTLTYIRPQGSQNISVNDTYDVTALAEVVVSVGGGTPTLQTKSKTYTPTESQQTETVTADSGYDGLEEVDITVNAISDTYVGSAINRRDSTSLSASGATVSVPAGYYESAASKAVSSGSATAPATISGSSATMTTGTNTMTFTKTISVTPVVTAGYVSSGTAGNASVSLTASVTTQSASGNTTLNATTTSKSFAAGYYANAHGATVSLYTGSVS